MGLPQHDHARRNHLLHQGGGRGRAAVMPGPTAPRGHAARDLDEILHRHRDAMERADAMARRHAGRRGVRRGPGLVGVDIDVRVELCIITGDAVQVALDDCYRGDLTLRPDGHAAGAPARMRVASAPPWAVSFSQVCERAAAIQPGSLSPHPNAAWTPLGGRVHVAARPGRTPPGPRDPGGFRRRRAAHGDRSGTQPPIIGPHEGLGAVGEHFLHLHHDGELGAFALEGQAFQ